MHGLGLVDNPLQHTIHAATTLRPSAWPTTPRWESGAPQVDDTAAGRNGGIRAEWRGESWGRHQVRPTSEAGDLGPRGSDAQLQFAAAEHDAGEHGLDVVRCHLRRAALALSVEWSGAKRSMSGHATQRIRRCHLGGRMMGGSDSSLGLLAIGNQNAPLCPFLSSPSASRARPCNRFDSVSTGSCAISKAKFRDMHFMPAKMQARKKLLTEREVAFGPIFRRPGAASRDLSGGTFRQKSSGP